MKFYVTFGQKDISRRDGYIEIEAINYQHAQITAAEIFKRDFSNIYEENEFDESYYPKGCLERYSYL